MSVNKVILVGNLGSDPELRYSGAGTAICKFRLATTDYAKGQETTEWHSIITFGKQAEFCSSYLSKGSLVSVEGKLQYSEFQNKSGVTVKATDIVADRVQSLTSSKKSSKPSQEPTLPEPAVQESSEDAGVEGTMETEGDFSLEGF